MSYLSTLNTQKVSEMVQYPKTKDGHRDDDKPVEQCKAKLARLGLTREDVQTVARKLGMKSKLSN